ncbi:hypothetical protein ILT44_29505 [Microvirga sp. BT689]|uniref:hypothetical protein n=1 Tax=Microvirga arvi TaxID=2778731 RepID=UPI0019516109|nr:hypothetical protein [Microvirga arvi]MBM6584335.1 hypothetical protein [Microvirga arvi]
MIAVAGSTEFAWPGHASSGLWVLLIWLIPVLVTMRANFIEVLARELAGRRELSEMRQKVEDLERKLIQARASLDASEAKAQGSQRRLAEATAYISRLEKELLTAKAASTSSAGHLLFRRVGLDRDCPKWVAECVRREYRKRLHPDTKAPPYKSEAERRFKEAEQVFEQVWLIREF